MSDEAARIATKLMLDPEWHRQMADSLEYFAEVKSGEQAKAAPSFVRRQGKARQ